MKCGRQRKKSMRGIVSEGLKAPVPFYGFGMSYTRFAGEEPELYRLLFLEGAAHGENGAMEAMHRSQNLIRNRLKRYTIWMRDTADRYFRDMWLVVHSLATLIVTGECLYSEKSVRSLRSVAACARRSRKFPDLWRETFDRDKEFRRLFEG